MNKIASVELLRFVSAMMVIIWHYQQFYLPYNIFSEVEILPFNRNTQPFYNYLSLFYNFGNRGVDFFFIISGYVFSYVYLFKNESVKFKFFFVNRLARLYPLHILTLIIVAIMQFYNSVSFDNFLIHFNNDAYHFFLNLFFISGWGFEQGPSFNGPIWSVSVEIIIYFLFFFLIMNFNNNRVLNSILLILIFISIKKISSENFLNYSNLNLLNCGILFFEGVLVYYFSDKIYKKKILFLSGIFLLVISLIGNFKMYIFLPSILMMFLSVENLIKNRMCKIFNFLGNLTYGTYLWHLPIQMCLIIFMKKNNINFSVIDTKIFFLLYLFFVISVSVISYYFFELKLRYLIRSKFND